jgi:hypothetical protein
LARHEADGDAAAKQLTPGQAAFVEAYVEGKDCIGNATRAAIAAGFSEHTARVQGSQMLAKPHIQNAIRNAKLSAISGRISLKALRLIEATIDDENAPLKIRVQCAIDMLDRDGIRAAPGRSLTDAKPGDARAALREGIGELLQAFKGLRPASDQAPLTIDGETEGDAED